MKKIMRNNRILALAFLTLFGSAALAAPVAKDPSQVPAELTLSSVINNQPLVLLSLQGDEQQDDFTILISDNYGNILYRENIRAARFTKRFLFNTDEIGNDTLQMEIISNKTKKSKIFAIQPSAASQVNATAIQEK